MRGLVQLPFCGGGDGEVEGGAEEAAFAAGKPVCELVRVFGGGCDAEVGQASFFAFEPSRRFEAGALFLQPLRGEFGRKRFDVQRQIKLAGAGQQRG